MDEKYNTTVMQDLEALKVDKKYFDEVYDFLRKNQRLPLPDKQDSLTQYISIVEYFVQNNILHQDYKFNEQGLKIFSARLTLENRLSEADTRSLLGEEIFLGVVFEGPREDIPQAPYEQDNEEDEDDDENIRGIYAPKY